MKKIINETAFCKTHIRYVGQDQFGHYYPTCFVGHQDKEKCDIEITRTYDDETQEVSEFESADKKREQEDNESFFWLHNR